MKITRIKTREPPKKVFKKANICPKRNLAYFSNFVVTDNSNYCEFNPQGAPYDYLEFIFREKDLSYELGKKIKINKFDEDKVIFILNDKLFFINIKYYNLFKQRYQFDIFILTKFLEHACNNKIALVDKKQKLIGILNLRRINL